MRDLARRAVAAHWTVLTLIGLIIAVCGSTLFAVPGFLDQHRSTSLHAALAGNKPGTTDLTVTALVGSAGADALDLATNAVPFALSPTLQSVLTETSTTVRTGFAAIGTPQTAQKLASPQGDPPSFSLRSPYGSAGQLRKVAGAAPPDAKSAGSAAPATGDAAAGPPPVLVWISQRNATDLHVSVGDRFTVSGKAFHTADAIPLQVAGIFAPVRPQDPYWLDPDGGPTTLAAPRLGYRQDPLDHDTVSFLTVDLLFQNGDADRIIRSAGLTATWTFTPQADRVTPAVAPAVIADLSRLASGGASAMNPMVSGTPVLTSAPGFVSQLPAILGDYLHDAGTAMILMSLGLSCLLAVAVGVLVLAVRLLLHRQRDELVVCRARGASVPMIARAVALQTAAVAVPAAALAAAAVVGAGYAKAGPGIAVAAVVTMAGACLLAAGMAAGELRGTGAARGGVARRLGDRADAVARATVEAFVFLVLAAEVTTLHSRGITGDAAAGIDPLTAALPVAIALAAGVVLLRLRPMLPAFLGWLLGNGRGATGFVGTANARRDSAVGGIASVVILMTLSSAVFGATFSTSLTDARNRSEWQAVGAPGRVTDPLAGLDASAITPGDVARIRGTAGVTAVANASVDSTATIGQTKDSVQKSLTVVGVDVAAYLEVIRGTGADGPGLRTGLTALLAAVSGHPASDYTPYSATPLPLPALVSRDLADQASGPLTATIGGRAVPLRVVGFLDGLPTGIATGTVIVVGFDQQRAATPTAAVESDVLLAGTPAGLAAVEDVGARNGFSDSSDTVTLEAGVHGGTNARPLGALVQKLQVAETALEAALCALAVLLTLAIGASARGRAAAFLATMGFGRGQLRRVAVIETLPLLVLVAAGGVGTGILVLPVLAGSIDLPTLTGLTTQLRVRADLTAVVVAAVAVPGIALAAVLGEGFLRRRTGVVGVLRAGDR